MDIPVHIYTPSVLRIQMCVDMTNCGQTVHMCARDVTMENYWWHKLSGKNNR